MNIQAKIAAAVAAILLVLGGVWYVYHLGYKAGSNEVQVQWDADKIKRDEAQVAALIAYADRIRQGVEEHAKQQVIINGLTADAGRVHIHLPACPGNTAPAGQNPDGSAGLLSDRVDQGFARLQERVGRLFARCDQLNIDAIQANGTLAK